MAIGFSKASQEEETLRTGLINGRARLYGLRMRGCRDVAGGIFCLVGDKPAGDSMNKVSISRNESFPRISKYAKTEASLLRQREEGAVKAGGERAGGGIDVIVKGCGVGEQRGPGGEVG